MVRTGVPDININISWDFQEGVFILSQYGAHIFSIKHFFFFCFLPDFYFLSFSLFFAFIHFS